MDEKEKIEQMVDEEDMLDFFESNHKAEVEMAKMAILHAFHNYIDGIKKIYENFTKGMKRLLVTCLIATTSFQIMEMGMQSAYATTQSSDSLLSTIESIPILGTIVNLLTINIPDAPLLVITVLNLINIVLLAIITIVIVNIVYKLAELLANWVDAIIPF